MTGKEVSREKEGQRQGQGQRRQAEVLITVAPAADHELDRFCRQWVASLRTETRAVEAFGSFVQVGPKRGLGLRHRLLHRALRLSTAELIGGSLLAIAQADGIQLGWCSFELPVPEHPLTVHFTYVDPLARRRGIGRSLLCLALAHRDTREPRFTCITSDGAALLRAVAALSSGMGAYGDERIASDGVVDARGP